MPIYEYRCATCGRFEERQAFSDPKLSACPTCGAPVERLLSGGVGLVFKGTGWYITDYQRKGASSEDGAAPAAEAGKPAAAEGTPAAVPSKEGASSSEAPAAGA